MPGQRAVDLRIVDPRTRVVPVPTPAAASSACNSTEFKLRFKVAAFFFSALATCGGTLRTVNWDAGFDMPT